ncbi:hypothetical protein, conserved [Trypanosoma brucei brucei TREU927]|uniref:Uncharacterized protein n=1 Tax=Trypanosoma brucei brucei (strain 927/4 GUTat10.1) TaxID=185431 RepID=Q38DD1_TRYB2|nr:hypothetical protein, conserved [Trypanosoma brucei brucei TREU927]EAN77189.1 hypothetical protein, conserved [Trypanosoma brucei brucei TREU927]
MQKNAPKFSVSKWNILPANRRSKFFWEKLNEYLEPLLSADFPLMDEEFRGLCNVANQPPGTHPVLSETLIATVKNLRSYCEGVTLWNPLSLAAHLDIPPTDVIEQLLLAKEAGLVSMVFVVPCQSCGCDMLRANSVGEICFRATYHKSNVIDCPMCTDRNEVDNLARVAVYFQDATPLPLLSRKFHRLFYSQEVVRRCLETVFCPQDCAFMFNMRLPEGTFLIIAPGLGVIVQLEVETGAQFLERNRPYHDVRLLLSKFVTENNSDSAETANVAQDRNIIKVKHGKLSFRVFNDTQHATFLDICIAFDVRLEFLSPKKPVVTTVPMLLHHSTRGLRSPLFYLFTPAPPGVRTSGVYVLHSFEMPNQDMEEVILSGSDSTVAVIREVHRYSLEDHSGLLLSVGVGGATFESSFMSYTAALASSLCFAQRLVTRLGNDIAGALSCSITAGELYMASFKGQYDDDENERSAYPSVQIIGPAVYAGHHPPPAVDPPCTNELMQKYTRNVRFEMRVVSDDNTGVCLKSLAADEMLDPFLTYMQENFVGVEIKEEPQALVVVVPLDTLNAKVKLASLVDSTTYTKEIHGPFG